MHEMSDGHIYVLQKSRDIFWFLHFAMDMMQFYTGELKQDTSVLLRDTTLAGRCQR